MNIRWLYWAIGLVMASSLVTSLYNTGWDAFLVSFFSTGATLMLIGGAYRLEERDEQH